MEGMGTKKAAEVLHVSQETVARWCREKRIPGAEQDDVGFRLRLPVISFCQKSVLRLRMMTTDVLNL